MQLRKNGFGKSIKKQCAGYKYVYSYDNIDVIEKLAQLELSRDAMTREKPVFFGIAREFVKKSTVRNGISRKAAKSLPVGICLLQPAKVV